MIFSPFETGFVVGVLQHSWGVGEEQSGDGPVGWDMRTIAHYLVIGTAHPANYLC